MKTTLLVMLLAACATDTDDVSTISQPLIADQGSALKLCQQDPPSTPSHATAIAVFSDPSATCSPPGGHSMTCISAGHSCVARDNAPFPQPNCGCSQGRSTARVMEGYSGEEGLDNRGGEIHTLTDDEPSNQKAWIPSNIATHDQGPDNTP